MDFRGKISGFCPISTLRPLLVGLVAVCAFVQTSAQERNLRFEQYYPESGLSQGSIKCMLQDRRGFLWFGTEDGLNRYDGYRFRVYRRDDQDPSSLPHSYIQVIAEDRTGTLWVGTRAGLARQTEDGKFERFRHDSENPHSLANDEILSIVQTRDDRVWIGTRGGLSRWDPSTAQFENFRHDPGDADSLGSDVILALYEDRRGRLWVGTDGGGLHRWKPTVRRFERYRHDPADPSSLSDDRISAIGEDGVGRLWAGSLGGTLDRIDDRKKTIVRHVGPGAESGLEALRPVRTLIPDAERNLWIGTDSGLAAYNPDQMRIEIYRRDEADPRSLSADRVLSLHKDFSDMLWVGTTHGLNKTNLRSSNFRVTHAGAGDDDLKNSIVTSIHTGSGGVWIGTFGGGLSFRDEKTGQFTHYTHDEADPNSLSGDRVMSVVVSRDGTVWAGTFGGGLNRLSPGSDRFKRYVHDPEDPDGLSEDGITALLEDRQGRIWISAFKGGLHRYLPDTDRFVHYRHDPQDPTSLPDPRVLAIFEDQRGEIWLGTATAGIAHLDPKTGIFSSYRSDPDSADSLSDGAVYSFYEDPNGNLWIGTQGGLHRWSSTDRQAKRARFARYTTADGLPNNVVYGILPDEFESLWLSTNHGLSRFDPDSANFTNFNTSHGLQGREFNLGAVHRGPDGDLFFGGTNGYNRFDPRQVRSNGNVPPVLITSIRGLNEPLALDRPTWDLDEIEVGYRDYVLSFEFSALDYVDSERNQYAYKLEGLDDDWVLLGNDRRATYTNLAPGKYNLRVRAANNDGLWNNTGTELALMVRPPPWRTWWAYTIYVLAIVILIGAYVRAVRRKLRREAEYSRRLEVEVALRTDQLQAANLQLESAALTDPLTGLYNRRYLMTSVDAEAAAAERKYRGAPPPKNEAPEDIRDFALLMIDLDEFKSINDTHGHDAGDRALCQTADLLRSCSRGSDSLIRLGGDEFMVVARDVTVEGAQVLASRICERIGGHAFDLGDGVSRRISCSLGYSFYPFLPEAPTRIEMETVISIADRALYLGKARGRNVYIGVRANEDTPDNLQSAAILENFDEMIETGLLELEMSAIRGADTTKKRA